jgi:small subunit ribosomal protein S17
MKRRQLTGTVVSDKPDQTVIVKVDRRKVHPLYRKAYSVSKKFAAHDPENAFKTGTVVTIEETRPISKSKRFKVVSEASPEAVAAPSRTPSKPAKPEAKADETETKDVAAEKPKAKKPAKDKDPRKEDEAKS